MRRSRAHALWVADRSGLAALEFALVAPMMLILLFGSIEITEALSAQARIEAVAGSLADVVARDSAISDAEMEDILAAADLLMFPADPQSLQVVISRVDVTGPGVGVIGWSDALRGPARLPNATLTDLPETVESLCVGRTIIMAEAQAEYASPLGLILTQPLTLTHRQLTCPRRVDDLIRTP